MLKHKILLFTLILTTLFSSNINKQEKPKEIFIFSMQNRNDTIKIIEPEYVSKIFSIIDSSEESLSKFRFKYRIEFYKGDSCIRIGVNKNRFKYQGKNYLSKENFEEYIDEIISLNNYK